MYKEGKLGKSPSLPSYILMNFTHIPLAHGKVPLAFRRGVRGEAARGEAVRGEAARGEAILLAAADIFSTLECSRSLS